MLAASPASAPDRTPGPSLQTSASSPEPASGAKPKAARAKRTKKPREPQRNLLEPNKVDQYLASIYAAGIAPTLDDIERRRPAHHAFTASHAYADEYHNLVQTLCRSFSKEQLRDFVEQYGLDPVWATRNRRKVEYAESIIEKQWGWPSLKELERKRRDVSEVVKQTFPISRAHAFLVLGKDGADLLQMSMEYNVHISLTPNPLGLYVEGLRGSLKAFTEHLASVRKNIAEETFELPTKAPIPPLLVQRISRMSSAFVENLGNRGKVRMIAKDPRSLTFAKRLAMHAACEYEDMSKVPFLSYEPVEPPNPSLVASISDNYALYPFMSPRPLPWTMNTSGAFRVRRIGRWLQGDTSDGVRSTGGFTEDEGRFLTFHSLPGAIKEALFGVLSAEAGSERVVTASTGHLLFTSESQAQRATLVPPLPGRWPLMDVMDWMQTKNKRPTFVPSLPAPLLQSPPSEEKIVHRLIYHPLPVSATAVSSDSEATVSKARGTRLIKFEVAMPNPANDRQVSVDEEGGEDLEPQHEISDTSSRFWSGVRTELQVMLPDRPLDLVFSCFDYTPAAREDQPAELWSYFFDLRAYLVRGPAEVDQPLPPSQISYRGDQYALFESLSVRQSSESVKVLHRPPTTHDEPSAMPEEAVVSVISESVLDLESNNKSSVSQIVRDGSLSDEAWANFLRCCDQLTAAVNSPASTLPSLSLDHDDFA